MEDASDSGLTAADRKELYDKLRKVWDLGANVIIGWRKASGGIELIYLPGRGLPRAGKADPDLLDRNRHIEDSEVYRKLVHAGCRTIAVPLSFEVRENDANIAAMSAILRYYTVTHSQCRAVGLYDIVNFSLYTAFERVTLINVLAHHINLAAERVEAAGLPIDIAMSTTGDGFYIWNRKEGLPADLALFYVTGIAMGYNQMALEDNPQETIPHLRCCLNFGDHYEYYQASGTKPDSRGFIVGDVTINLARLISAAIPHQFLVGSYRRDMSRDDPKLHGNVALSRIDTPSFMAFAKSNAKLLIGSPLGDEKVARINTYLTGDRLSDDEFTIKKYEVTDKHGLLHRCFNAKFNITGSDGRSIEVGLLDADLAKFRARHMEDEGVRLKVVG